MIKLMKGNLSEWRVVSGRTTHLFPSLEGVFQCLIDLGVDPDEADLAICDMVNKGNNFAEFGINKMFIYSTTTNVGWLI